MGSDGMTVNQVDRNGKDVGTEIAGLHETFLSEKILFDLKNFLQFLPCLVHFKVEKANDNGVKKTTVAKSTKQGE